MTRSYRAVLTGPFPRPEALVQATRDLDRGRLPPDAAEAVFRDAEERVRGLEAELGLDGATGGHLRWPDPFRPFTELWQHAEPGALTRFFETNTFYRRPVLHAAPVGGHGRLADWLPRGRGSRAILPGPYTFAAVADVRYAPATAAGTIVEVANALAADLRALGDARPDQIEFLEPMLVYAPPRRDWAAVGEAYRRLAVAAAGAHTTIWTHFGDAGPVLAAASGLAVDAFGFDLFETEIPPDVDWRGRAVGLGCLDPTTTIPEDEAEVARRVRAVERALSPTEVWLGPSPPFDLLPFEAAAAKLALLPRLREVLRS